MRAAFLFLFFHDPGHPVAQLEHFFFQIVIAFQLHCRREDEQQAQRHQHQQSDHPGTGRKAFARGAVRPGTKQQQGDGAEDAQAHARRNAPAGGLHKAQVVVRFFQRHRAQGFRLRCGQHRRRGRIGRFESILQ